MGVIFLWVSLGGCDIFVGECGWVRYSRQPNIN